MDEEIKIVYKLKDACIKNANGFYEEDDVQQTADLFVELADTFARDPLRNEDLQRYRCLIHRGILLNAALIRVTDETKKIAIKNKICGLGIQVIQIAHQDIKSPDNLENDILKSTERAKSLLLDMRRKTLDSLEGISNKSDKSDSVSIESEVIKISRVDNLMSEITQDYKALMKRLSDECIKMLGKPPCRFAHVAMGSLCRGVVTPYSDFENAVLFDDTDDKVELSQRQLYFRSYAVLFELIVINFGETPIRLGGIDCLNDFYSPDKKQKDWFWDRVTPCGIQFDSHMPFASKTPLGRSMTTNKPWTVELIGTKSYILGFLDMEVVLKEGYHLAEMLSLTSFVAGNLDFFEEYSKDAAEKMTCNLQLPKGFGALTTEYQENIKRFSIETKIEHLGSKKDVKRVFYRSFALFIPYLERLTGIHNGTTWQNTVQNWLRLPAGLSKEAAHNLLYALALVNEVRLKLYTKRRQQSNVVAGTQYLLPSSDKSTSIFNVLNKSDFLTVFEIGLSWNTALTQIIDSIMSMDESSNRQECVIRCLNAHLQKRNDSSSQGLILEHFQDYDGAKECFQKSLLDKRATSEEKISVLVSIGRCYVHSLKFIEGAEYVGEALKLAKESKSNDATLAEVLEWLGRSFLEFDVPKSLEAAKDSEKLWKKLYKSEPENRSYLDGLAGITDALAWTYYKIEDFQNSLSNYIEAARLYDEYYRNARVYERLNHKIINVQNGIALCYHALKKYNDALRVFEKVLKMKQRLIGNQAADVGIAYAKRAMADCYKELEDYDKAEELYFECMRIKEASVGSQSEKNCSFANTKHRLADCYYRRYAFVKAINMVKESFFLGEEELKWPSGIIIMRRAMEMGLRIVERFMASSDQVTDVMNASLGVAAMVTFLNEIRTKLMSTPANIRDQFKSELRQIQVKLTALENLNDSLQSMLTDFQDKRSTSK